MLVLVDLSGEAGEASVPLPADLLGRWPRRALLRLSQHRLVVAPGPKGELTERFGGGSGASGEAAAPPEPELYSADELRRGSLTVRAPRRGLVALQLEARDASSALSETLPGRLRDASETPQSSLGDTLEQPPGHARATSLCLRHFRDASETLLRITGGGGCDPRRRCVGAWR